MKEAVVTVLCFGNPDVPGDDVAYRLAGSLKIDGFRFVPCDNPQRVLDYTDKEFVILDVAKGIKDITVIRDPDQLGAGRLVSLHDFDLGFFLKLMSAVGKLSKPLIIGLPYGMDESTAGERLEHVLRSVY